MLAALLAAPWYEIEVNTSGLPTETVEIDAWRAFDLVDVVILASAAVSAFALALGARRPWTPAAVAVALIGWRLIDTPGPTDPGIEGFSYATKTTWGVWVTLATALALLAACLLADRRRTT